jgi:hypothetical protein
MNKETTRSLVDHTDRDGDSSSSGKQTARPKPTGALRTTAPRKRTIPKGRLPFAAKLRFSPLKNNFFSQQRCHQCKQNLRILVLHKKK